MALSIIDFKYWNYTRTSKLLLPLGAIVCGGAAASMPSLFTVVIVALE
jgi:hypothetical protein